MANPKVYKPVVFTTHALEKMADRGVSKEQVLEAIRIGRREPARRGLWQYRLNLEYQRLWGGRFYGIQQIMPIVAEEPERHVVVTVYSFYFAEGAKR